MIFNKQLFLVSQIFWLIIFSFEINFYITWLRYSIIIALWYQTTEQIMEKDILNYSPTVMFRGTPCSCVRPHIWYIEFKELRQVLFMLRRHVLFCIWGPVNTIQSLKIKTGYRYGNQFWNLVSRMGLGSFVDINIFIMKNYVIQFLHILHLFKSLKSKSKQKTTKRKIKGFVQRYSFKFRALSDKILIS